MPTRQEAAPRRPLSLHAEAQAEATQTHTRRMAELQALAPLLTQLNALRPALAGRKLTIYPDSISLDYVYLDGGYTGPRHKVLRLRTGAMFDRNRPCLWLAALRDLGLRIIDFSKTGTYGSVLLRKGTLLMRVDLADPDRDALLAEQAKPPVVHCAAGQVAATAAAHPDKTVVCTTGDDGLPLPGGYAMAPLRQTQHAQQVAA